MHNRLYDDGYYTEMLYRTMVSPPSKRKPFNPRLRGLLPWVARERESWQRTMELLHNQMVVQIYKAYNRRTQLLGVGAAEYLQIPPHCPTEAQWAAIRALAPTTQGEMLAMTDEQWVELGALWPELEFTPLCTNRLLRMRHYQLAIGALVTTEVPPPPPPPGNEDGAAPPPPPPGN